LAVWIILTAIYTPSSCLTTDIIDGVCIPLGVHSSREAQVAITSVVTLIGYIIPMLVIITCYSRIVYIIRKKVSCL